MSDTNEPSAPAQAPAQPVATMTPGGPIYAAIPGPIPARWPYPSNQPVYKPALSHADWWRAMPGWVQIVAPIAVVALAGVACTFGCVLGVMLSTPK